MTSTWCIVSGVTMWHPTSWPSATTAENGPPSMMGMLTGWVHLFGEPYKSSSFPPTHWPPHVLFLSSCFLETATRTLLSWTGLQSLWWHATSESSLRAGTALSVWGWRSWAALCLVSLTFLSPQKHFLKTLKYDNHISFSDSGAALYRLNDVSSVDYLEFKHHSYSEMVEVCPYIL